ncbi:MAG: hypothetical protein HRT54_24035 [Colwellia sp.]|nr:hypothetical protein [Colwellia sp.]
MTKKLKALSFYFSLSILLMSWVSVPVNAEANKLEKNISNFWMFVPKQDNQPILKKHF